MQGTPTAAPVLRGRDREVELAVARLTAEQPGVVVISASAGSGKTTLLRALQGNSRLSAVFGARLLFETDVAEQRTPFFAFQRFHRFLASKLVSQLASGGQLLSELQQQFGAELPLLGAVLSVIAPDLPAIFSPSDIAAAEARV